MFIIFLRVLIIYIVVLIFLRLMGKRQLGEMQPYEVVITLIIADLATLPMSDSNIPLLNGILPLAILVLIHYIITFLTRKSVKIRRLLSGRPVIVVSPNGIEYKAIQELNMNIDDLIEMMRQLNYYSFDQVLYAIIETNGKMSIIPSSSSAPATASDVGKGQDETSLPSVVIADGKIIKDELKKSKIDNKKLSSILKHLKITKQDEVIIMSIDESGKLYYQLKGQPYKLISNIFEVIKK